MFLEGHGYAYDKMVVEAEQEVVHRPILKSCSFSTLAWAQHTFYNAYEKHSCGNYKKDWDTSNHHGKRAVEVGLDLLEALDLDFRHYI